LCFFLFFIEFWGISKDTGENGGRKWGKFVEEENKWRKVGGDA
jgi:hypothetical protein